MTRGPAEPADPARPGERAGPALRWDFLGRARYGAALARQHQVRDAVLAGQGAPALLLCEHPPVITLGRAAAPGNVLTSAAQLARLGVEVVQIERGGDVTYHGPGQLMIYPVIPIVSALAFLARVGEVLAAVSERFGVPGAAFRERPAGLWLGEDKLAACGIHLRRGVVLHGWAFNVDTPEAAWRHIRPCGGEAPQVSLCQARARRGLAPVSVAAVAAQVGPALATSLLAVMRR